MRVAEKRMTELSVGAQKLRIREAELRSLYGLESASSQPDMRPIEGAVSSMFPDRLRMGSRRASNVRDAESELFFVCEIFRNASRHLFPRSTWRISALVLFVLGFRRF